MAYFHGSNDPSRIPDIESLQTVAERQHNMTTSEKLKICIYKTFQQNGNNESSYMRNILSIYPYLYAIIHSCLIIFLNILIILFQLVLTGKKSPYFWLFGGFWAGGFNIITAVFVLLLGLKAIQTSRYLTLVTAMSCVSILTSLIGFVVIQLFAISYYDSCPSNKSVATMYCKHPEAKDFNEIVIGFGTVSILLTFVYFTVNLGAVTGGCLQLDPRTSVENPHG